MQQIYSAGEPLEGAEGDNRALKSDGASIYECESLARETSVVASPTKDSRIWVKYLQKVVTRLNSE